MKSDIIYKIGTAEIRNSLSILTISYMFQQHGPSGAKVTINPGYMTATIKIKK